MKLETFKLERVTSTNDAVIDLIKKNNKSSGLVYANVQTLGRGTRGRKWISDEGNLFATLFFPLENKFPSFAEFSVINPVIISEVITNICEAKNITLNENITFNYVFDNNQILIDSLSKNKNQKIKISSKVQLDPFYFDTKIIMAEQP